jgi:hypothetical protein
MLLGPSEAEQQRQLNAPRSYLLVWLATFHQCRYCHSHPFTGTVGDMQRAQQRYRAHVFVRVRCGTTTIDVHHFSLIKIQNTNELSEAAQKTSAQATP